MSALIAATNEGRWFRDWGALIVAGIAAVVSIWNAVTSYLARRKDWQRELRVPRYAAFAAQAQRLHMLTRALLNDTPDERVDKLSEAQHDYDTAFDELLIVGPTAVSDAAHIVNQSIADWFECARWDSQSFVEWYPMFRIAMRDFITAASAAIGTGEKNRHATFARRKSDYESWRTAAEKSRAADPGPPPPIL